MLIFHIIIDSRFWEKITKKVSGIPNLPFFGSKEKIKINWWVAFQIFIKQDKSYIRGQLWKFLASISITWLNQTDGWLAMGQQAALTQQPYEYISNTINVNLPTYLYSKLISWIIRDIIQSGYICWHLIFPKNMTFRGPKFSYSMKSNFH